MKQLFFIILLLIAIINSCLFAQGPVLSWAKSMGGTGHDYSNFITYDNAGNVYTTGNFSGTVDFDPNAGTYNLTSSGGVWPDVFICKLDPSGNFLWAKNVGGNSADDGYSLAVDGAGNVYTTGHFQDTADFNPGTGIFNLPSGNGSSDIFILKLDSLGNFDWAKSIGSNSDDVGYSIAIDAADNILVTGFYEGTVDFDPDTGISNLVSGIFADAFILKLNSSGNYIWAKSLSGLAIENGRSIAVDEAGNVYTLGVYQNTVDFDPGPAIYNLTAAGVYDIYISKLNPSGNFIWAKSAGGAEYDHGHAMALDASANIYFTGTFQGTSDFNPDAGIFNLIAASNSQDIFICKLDSMGNFKWASSMGANSSDQGTGIAVDNSGNVYYTGFFNGTVDFDPGAGTSNLTSVNDDVFISKMDSLGNFQWAETITGNFAQLGESIAADEYGNVYTTGEFEDIADFDPASGVFNLSSNGLTHFDIFIQKLAQTTTGLNNLFDINLIQVYPNPSSGKINFKCFENLIDADIRVYNAYGQLAAQSENITGNIFTIDLDQSMNGVYFMSITTSKKILKTKFVIQH